MRRAAALTVLALFAAGAPPRAAADDAAPPGGPAPAAPGDAPADPPKDPAREQRFADRGAEDALKRLRSPGIVDVWEALEHLSRLKSAKVTAEVIEVILGRKEFHAAEYAGWALAQCDPDGAMERMQAAATASKAPSQIGRAHV